jgi:nitronate monooxygenase
MLKTRLTEQFELRRPITLAPLGNGATSGHLAAAVSEAGGLGLFGGIHAGGPEWIREHINLVRSRTNDREGVR